MLAHIRHTQVHAHTWGWGQFLQERERLGCYHYAPEKVVSTFSRSQSCLWDPTLSATFQRLLGTSMCPSRTSYSFANYPYRSSIPNSILHQWLYYSKAFPHVSSCCAASSHVLLGEFHRSLLRRHLFSSSWRCHHSFSAVPPPQLLSSSCKASLPNTR